MIVGDTHANTEFLCEHIYPLAARHGAHAIVQLGDFGYWEHEPEGVDFLDIVADWAESTEIPFCWLCGNHDNWPLAMTLYGQRRTMDGFVICRPGVNFIPTGHIWTWAGVRMRAFGGAYSIDKQSRLRLEARRWADNRRREQARREAGVPTLPAAPTAGTLWFPQEEMTDAQLHQLLSDDSAPVDIIFSHDKPRGSNPGVSLKDLPECLPNQDRLQTAMRVHQPMLWFHGHLHMRYTDRVRCGNDDRWTEVHGLDADPRASRSRISADAWTLLDLDDGRVTAVTSGVAATARRA